jgi:hypothetical protein
VSFGVEEQAAIRTTAANRLNTFKYMGDPLER